MNNLDVLKLQKLMSNEQGNVSLFYSNLVDAHNQTYTIDADRIMPAASLIKVLVLVEALRQVERRSLKLGQRITIQDHNRVEGSRINEFEDKKDFSLLELMRWMIIVSDDTATNQIIELIGMDKVNALSVYLGLDHTRLVHKMKDQRAMEQGMMNVTTASDMGHLLRHIMRDAIPHQEESKLSAFICRQTIALMRECRDDNALMRHIPWTVSCAHKTGQQEAMGHYARVIHDMGIIIATGGSYILVVMAEDVPSLEEGQKLVGMVAREIYHQVLYTP